MPHFPGLQINCQQSPVSRLVSRRGDELAHLRRDLIRCNDEATKRETGTEQTDVKKTDHTIHQSPRNNEKRFTSNQDTDVELRQRSNILRSVKMDGKSQRKVAKAQGRKVEF